MKKILTYIGEDDWGSQVYKDDFGVIWKDLDNRESSKCKLYNSGFDFHGEPCFPISGNIEIEFIPERVIVSSKK